MKILGFVHVLQKQNNLRNMHMSRATRCLTESNLTERGLLLKARKWSSHTYSVTEIKARIYFQAKTFSAFWIPLKFDFVYLSTEKVTYESVEERNPHMQNFRILFPRNLEIAQQVPKRKNVANSKHSLGRKKSRRLMAPPWWQFLNIH